MEYLIGLLFGLAIVAAVGHGLWLLVAAIFRFIFDKPEPPPVSATSRCVKCGANLRAADDFCAVCGHWQKSGAASPLADLAMAARQMDRFLNQGKIDLEAYRRVMKAIEEERERLTAPIRPQPVTEPVIETPPLVQPVIASLVEQPNFTQSPQPRPVEKVIQQPAVAPPPPPYIQPEPRRSLTEMLETFMEESSIRWGELVGGLLIIGCSLALVISLWSQIKGEPLLKFSVFVGMTAGLFGMGFYSAHRWKLPTTSRGALIISTLLVPLDFLAMAAPRYNVAPNAPHIIAGELLAMALFIFLVYHAGNVIAPGNSGHSHYSWLLAGATLTPSFAMLMAKHWPETHVAQAEMLFLSLAPLISYWGSTGFMLRSVKEEEDDSDSEADRLFTLFGLASFASLLPVALLIAKSGNVIKSLHTFSPLIALLGIPAIATGLTLMRLRQTKAKLSGRAQTTATTITILGAMLALAGLMLAWPRPLAVISVALINCAICGAIAWRFDLKPAHAAAIPFFALAWLMGANVLAGDFPSWSEDDARLAATFASRTSGLAWLALFVLVAVAAEVWRRFGRKTESRMYELTAYCAAFFSLSLLTWRGFGRAGDPQHLAVVYLFYAAAAFAIAWYRNQFVAGWIGACLSLLAPVQTFVYEFGYALAPYHPVRLSLLVYASLATVAAIVLQRAGKQALRNFAWPLTYAALFSSVAVAPFLLFGGWMNVGQMSSRMLWLAGIWLALSVMKTWPKLFTAFQAALSIGVVCGVAAIFDSRALPSQSSWLNPHLLQAEGIALALLSLTWLMLRIAVRRSTFRSSNSEKQIPTEGVIANFERLLYPAWPAVDWIAATLVLLLLIALCIGGIVDLTLIRRSVDRALGIGCWLLLLAMLLVFIVGLWEQFRKRLILAMMTLLACACLLSASLWRDSDVVLAALRYLLAASFALTALPIIFREQVRHICQQFGWPLMKEKSPGLASLSRAASLGLFAAPVLALTPLLISIRLPGSMRALPATIFFIAPLVILSLTLAAHAIREHSSGYALSSGLMLNLAITLGCFLRDANPVTIIQANLITSAIFSLLWLTVSRRLVSREAEKQSSPSMLLRFQIDLTLLASLLLLAEADRQLLVDPRQWSQMAASMGGVWGWLTILLPALAFARLREWRFERLHVDLLGVALLAASSLIGCSVSLIASGWTVYHALMIGIAASAWLMLALCWKREVIFSRFKLEGNDTSVGWATGLGLAQLMIVVRGLEAPGDVWWTAGSFAALCLLFTGLAVVTRQRGYVYLGGLLCNLAVTRMIFWTGGLLLDRYLVMANVVTLCLSSLIWLALDLAVMRQGKGSRIAPFHRVAARLALAVVVPIAVSHWLASLAGGAYTGPFDWLALGSLAALLVGCLWDGETDLSWRGLHAIGLIVIGKALASLHLASYTLFASTAAAWSVYALATVLLWRKRAALSRLAEGLRIPQRAGVVERMWYWLAKGNTLLAAFVAFCSFATVFNSDSLKLRLLVTTAAFALPLAFALLASGERRRLLIAVGIRLCLLDVLLWCWAWLTPGAGLQLINRLVIVMLIAEVVLIAYRLLATNQLSPESEWRTAWRDDLWWVAVAGLASLSVVLGIEVSNYVVFGSALIGWPVILALLATLIGVCLIGLAFALLPGEDPFGL
ncbi:MAG: hypothetical protein ABI977_20560, partial [Acidobacteriota bacterium]